tara:strand:+ start:9639 stop:9797 length:159 start_codon:yes stop_codon:yes gene_type:complete
MTHQEIEARLRKVEKKAEKAHTEAILCKEVMRTIMQQNAQYKEKLIECGYLI